MMQRSLKGAYDRFHPLIRRWFDIRFKVPTPVQMEAWNAIETGEHVLISAPTGSGKTLAAFLYMIDRMVSGKWCPGTTHLLYVSPMKALNNDMQKNLIAPLKELKSLFDEEKTSFPLIEVKTRSGDTPQSERQRMLRYPPEILITTPESLNIILTSKKASIALLGDIKAVIMDEIHAILGNKRGTYLISAVERLTLFGREFQRIALSATVHPVVEVSDFIGGYQAIQEENLVSYEKRRVRLVAPVSEKSYDLFIRDPHFASQQKEDHAFWRSFAAACHRMINRNRSTLIFVQSRKLSEKLTALINEASGQIIAYAHHGSLSRALRIEVENRLKDGKLKAIVATSSLELGIDIGPLDEVILIQSPLSISSSLQRIGRAGHSVGEVSRGHFLPINEQDIMISAVLLKAILEKDIEPAYPVLCPLDVLARIIISMVISEKWNEDRLFNFIKSVHPFHMLSRRAFDSVLEMLSGYHENRRIRQINPQIVIDGMDHVIHARKGASLAFYLSGGVIVDRGYFSIRHYLSNAPIGELDEEFVWEAKKGQIFTLGTQYWKIEKITQKDVFVSESQSGNVSPPFWKSDGVGRDFHLSHRLGLFLEDMNERLSVLFHSGDDACLRKTAKEYSMDTSLLKNLCEYLSLHKSLFGGFIPHRHHVVCEYSGSGLEGGPGKILVVHCIWGQKVNHPLALIIGAFIREKMHLTAEVFPGDDSIVIMSESKIPVIDIFSQLPSLSIRSIVLNELPGSGIFGSKFREAATRALMLPVRKSKERMPFWLSRLNAKKLFDSVKKHEDFPLMAEAFRTVTADSFDLEALTQIVKEIQTGMISFSQIELSHLSSMARTGAFEQINSYMYQDDRPDFSMEREFNGGWLEDFLYRGGDGFPLSTKDSVHFEQKRKRTEPGYSPENAIELFSWAKERLMIPKSEWEDLLSSIHRDHRVSKSILLDELSLKLAVISPKRDTDSFLIVPREIVGWLIYSLSWNVSELSFKDISGQNIPGQHENMYDHDSMTSDGADDLHVLSQWLSFYGPVSRSFIKKTLYLSEEKISSSISRLLIEKKLKSGNLINEINDDVVCEIENYRRLILLSKKRLSEKIIPRNIKYLQLFIANYQGLTMKKNGENSFEIMFPLYFCHFLPYDLWERDIFPARIGDYHPSWLDSMLQAGVFWIGSSNQRIAFMGEEELYLINDDLSSQTITSDEKDIKKDDIFPDVYARYPFYSLLRMTGLGAKELSKRLWEKVFSGKISSDSMAPLRFLFIGKKQSPNSSASYSFRNMRRGLKGRLQGRGNTGELNLPGNWFLLTAPDRSASMMEQEEIKKDRVRLLLCRYGILFREILERESSYFRWSAIFRTLRSMELSGEVVGGYFFHPLSGPQFIAKKSLKWLTSSLPENSIFWMNAKDPASLLGIISPCLTDGTESSADRVLQCETFVSLKSSHVVYHGTRLVMLSRKSGKHLDIFVSCDHPDIISYFDVLAHLLSREVDPLSHITIESINSQRADESSYLEVLKQRFEVVVAYKSVTLYKQ